MADVAGALGEKIMNKFLLGIALLGASAPSVGSAQEMPTILDKVPPMPGDANPQMATVTPFITGLKEPQGLALDNNGDIIVCDYGAGEVLRFSATAGRKERIATGLKNPSQIGYDTLFNPDTGRTVREFLVSERKANRVVRLRNEQVLPVGGEIIEPMGLLSSPAGRLYVVAHTTSKIYRLDKDSWKLVYEAADEDGDKGRYGLRCLANDGDTMFLSDEVNGDVLMVSPNGRIAKFASGFADPSGLAVRDDGLYVCDEGDGGRLWKVDKNGVKTLVAEKLGRPRNVLFTDDKTALVSDRDGRVLKLNWN